MKKNYNYNYVNRTTVKKPAVEYGNVEVASCTSSKLKDEAISNGIVWHTTDTNEFYYDWNGKRIKLSLTGDNASMAAEINKIKSDVAKLNPENLDALETKVNTAVSKVNTMSTRVNNAVSTAQSAAQAAQDAASQVEGKVNASDLAEVATSGSYNDLSDKPNLNNYATKSEIPSVEGLASESWVEGKGYLTEHQSLSAYAKKTDIPDVSNLATKSEIPSVEGLASESWVEGKGYLTSHQDISGKADKAELPTKVSDLTNDAGYLKEEDLPDFLTDSDLPDMTEGSFPTGDDVEHASADADGLATVQDVMDYVRAYFEKKKDELEPEGSEVPVAIPYLYTNGYKRGDTATELTDPLNAYEIELDGNGEFVIELLHKDESDGYFDPEGDPADNDPGIYFKVILPTGYNMTVYSWNPEATGDDKYELASTNDPGSNLVAYDVTPDNTTYYYSVVAIKYLWGGGKGVENSINTYGHLLKVVVTKNI